MLRFACGLRHFYPVFLFLAMLLPLRAQSFGTLAADFAGAEVDFASNSTEENLFGDDVASVDSDDFDDLDSIFFESTDLDEAVSDSSGDNSADSKKRAEPNFFIPLTLSGYLSSSLGAGAIYEDGSTDVTGYFDFYNYLYLNARPDKTFSVKGSVLTKLPGSSSDILRVRELYFDYLLLDRAYITAGKKGTVWGYTRLFSDDFDVSSEKEKLVGFSTNILDDSLNAVSVMLRIPFTFGTATALALYKGNAKDFSAGDMSYAASLELTIKKTSVNLFARKNPSEKSDYVKNGGLYKPHIAGLELKRTFWGTDVYIQELSQFRSGSELRRIFTEGDGTVFDAHLVTAGLYRWADVGDLQMGFNAEYQGEYLPESKDYYNRIFVDAGIKRLGPAKNIKVGVSWNHDFNSGIGYVKPGVIVSRIIPHADWDTGVKIEYGNTDSYVQPKITAGTYLKFAVNY